MKRIEDKMVFFLIVLICIEIIHLVISGFYFNILQLLNIEYDEEKYIILYTWTPYFTKVIFSIVLVIYCRLEVKNKLTIPILGFFYPVIGLVFYFIESEMVKKQANGQVKYNW
jgi:hypothetical protein